VFWAKGFAATSTKELLVAIGIGRQSLYNAFGDKQTLYLEALESYQRASAAGHLRRLNDSTSSLVGVRALLLGLIAEDERRAMGCIGVGAVSEFGTADPTLVEPRAKVGHWSSRAWSERLRDSQAVATTA
jgi:TetR/AcrR family transcriptional repressor of nem operon